MLLKKEEVVEMFQNINETENTKENITGKKNILANVISKKYIILYIITLMISMVNMGQAISPFSLAMIIACVANEIPIIAIIAFSLIGNIIGSGASGILNFILILLIFFASFFIKQPKINDESRNEKLKLTRRIFITTLIVNVVNVFIGGFLLYDLFVAISMSIITAIFYKIFANALTVIVNYNEKMAYSIEEVIGASLLFSIALCAFGDLSIYGFSIRNILSIFIVLLLGWKNGILVGTTTGVTIGVTLGIIANNEPIVVASYAISGMIAGILNKFGKLGVIAGFILGNIILSYISNGLVTNVILFKEILIAGIGLLAVPKNINISIENLIGQNRFLPTGMTRGLNKSKETVNKINNVSKVVKEMANTYKDVAATVIDEEDIKEKNKQTFIAELLNNIEHMEKNVLYDYISDVDGEIVSDIFDKIMEKQFIKEKDLIRILAKHNNYVVGFGGDESKIESDIEKMTQSINSAYRISKMNFVWSIRLNEEKKNMQEQLNGVSKALAGLAEDIEEQNEDEDKFEKEKEQINMLLKQKEILVQDISIKRKNEERYKIELYIEDNSNEDIQEIILEIIEKVLNEKLIITEEEEIKKEKIIKYSIISDDKYILEVGHTIAIKDNMKVSGDSLLQIKMKDGKYLLAISDGMGSGKEARNSSQIVIKMLKKLLNSGFERENSIKLINSSLLNVSDEIYATLDVAIVDLYKGNIEFIKSGACPTYIKQGKKVQLIKSKTLPTGVIKEIKEDVFDKDIENGEIVLMCSDGILDSNIEYKNKELWIKYMLEDIEISAPQKIADIILNEAIDNNFGKVKDDMSVIVCKLIKKA